MNEGWEYKRMNEVCELINGKAYKQQELLKQGKYRVLRVGNFFTNKDWYYSDLELPQEKYCDTGDLLYAWSASFGPRIWKEEKVIYHYHIWKVIPNETYVTKEFLFKLLEWDVEKIKADHGTGTTMMHVGKGSMDERELPIPPLSEQKRIVKILDETFAAIDKAKANVEKNLQNTKELFESYLQNVFANMGEDWEEKRLGDVLQKTEMIDPTKSPNKEFIYIDVSSVNKENLKIENSSIIKGNDAPSRARKLIKTNDIIFATVRPTLKRIAIISNEYNEQVCSTGYFVMRTTELLNHKLIFYYLQTDSFFKQMEKLQRGASYPAVTDGDVKNQIIHFPKSIQQQNKLASKLDDLSIETKKLETLYQQKLNDLEELKKSILQKAFNGELTAKEMV